MADALLHADHCQARVTVLGEYSPLNWRVRIEEECSMHGCTLRVGDTYIAGKSQLTYPETKTPFHGLAVNTKPSDPGPFYMTDFTDDAVPRNKKGMPNG